MLLLITVSTLVLIFSIIITAAIYLLYLIIEGTDDDAEPDALALGNQNFSTTPVVSPLATDSVNPYEGLCPHHHHDIEKIATIEQQSSNSRAKNTLISPVNSTPRLLTGKETVVKSTTKPQQDDKFTPSCRPSPSLHSSKSTQKSFTNGSGVKLAQAATSASKSILDDYDLKEMQLGGNSLHWCKSRKALDRLMKLELPINCLNKHQETPLHVATRKRNLQMVIGLLCHGADVGCRNIKGEIPLLVACKNNDMFAVQILLVFDSDVNCRDNMGFSARHYSAEICHRHKEQIQAPNAAHLILAMLNELGSKRCSFDSTNINNNKKNITKTDVVLKTAKAGSLSSKRSNVNLCTDGCMQSGSYNGNSYDRWVDYKKESVYKRSIFSDIIDGLLESIHKRRQGCKGSRLLCIDGGGMRGVIVCQIMIELEKFLRKPMISYFDWVGGTSVGAFLTCALSLGISIRDMRRICFDVKDEVFSGTRPYNPKFLERVLKRTYGATTRMSDVKGRKIGLTTVLADRDPCQLRLFRNYPSASELLEIHNFSAKFYELMSDHSTVNNAVPSSTNSTGKSTKSSRSATTLKSLTPSRSSSPNLIPPVSSKAVQSLETLATLKEELSLSKQVMKRDMSAKEESLAIKDDERDPFVWQAVRASSAAPFFFKPYGPFLDGGIIANNPTIDMLTEFHTHKKVKDFIKKRVKEKDLKSSCLENIPEELALVVSLGTGRGRVVGHQKELDFGSVASGLATVFSPVELLRSIRAARTLFKKLMHRSCMTDDYIVDRAQGWCASLNIPYFRINPPLAAIFSIDDKRDEQLINALWQTKLYVIAMSPQLEQLSDLLESFPSST